MNVKINLVYISLTRFVKYKKLILFFLRFPNVVQDLHGYGDLSSPSLDILGVRS